MLEAISFATRQETGLNAIPVRENLANYRDKQGIWSRQFVWEGVGVEENNVYLVTPLLWWRGLRGTCVLAEVAVKILGAPVTSAAIERDLQHFWLDS